jgi:hypothetical protein
MRNYLVQPKMIVKRNANYDLLSEIKSFSAIEEPEENDSCGNIEWRILYNIKTKKFERFDDEVDVTQILNKTHLNLYQIISSALAMYRLACLFEGKIYIYGQEKYKFVWEMFLKHNSGEIITISEWKGAFGIRSRYGSIKVDTEYWNWIIDDVIKLLNVIISPECPHPYDGLIAGGVA